MRCVFAGGVLLALAVACQKEPDDEGALGSAGSSGAGSSSGGRAGSGAIPTAGSTPNASGGSAGAPEPPPEGESCTELGGLEQCGSASVEAELKTIHLLIVIDKS